MQNKNYYDVYLGREYGTLPRWLQFFIFINQGVYSGVGTAGYLRCWKWSKLKRISCWKNKHKDIFHHSLMDSSYCKICGQQFKGSKNYKQTK
jgi:hypothetical protein